MGKGYYGLLTYYQYAYFPTLSSLGSLVMFPEWSLDLVLPIVGALLLSSTLIHARSESRPEVTKLFLTKNYNTYTRTRIY